jgi:hypothetical protein
MTKQIDEIMRLVDDLLETEHTATRKGGRAFLKSALEAALSQSQQVASSLKPGEPVAWRHSRTFCLYEAEDDVPLADGDEWAEPLYTAPPAQTKRLVSDESRLTPPRLTDGRISSCWDESREPHQSQFDLHWVFARAIESAVRRQFLGRDE